MTMNQIKARTKRVAIDAFNLVYGFAPKPNQITLLEESCNGEYILVKVGKYEYRIDSILNDWVLIDASIEKIER